MERFPVQARIVEAEDGNSKLAADVNFAVRDHGRGEFHAIGQPVAITCSLGAVVELGGNVRSIISGEDCGRAEGGGPNDAIVCSCGGNNRRATRKSKRARPDRTRCRSQQAAGNWIHLHLVVPGAIINSAIEVGRAGHESCGKVGKRLQHGVVAAGGVVMGVVGGELVAVQQVELAGFAASDQKMRAGARQIGHQHGRAGSEIGIIESEGSLFPRRKIIGDSQTVGGREPDD